MFAAPPSSFGNNNEGMTNVVGVSQIGYVTVIVCPPHNQARVRLRLHNILNDFQLLDDYRRGAQLRTRVQHVGFWSFDIPVDDMWLSCRQGSASIGYRNNRRTRFSSR